MLGDDRALYDFWGKSTSGPRNGMFVGQHCIDEIINDPQTAAFNWMLVDYALCNPYRTTFLSGLTRLHHDNENDEPGFYNKWMRGEEESTPLFGRPKQWNGPLFQDLAQQYAHQNSQSYDQSYLPQSHWPKVGRSSAIRNGVSFGPGITFDSSMTGKSVSAFGSSAIPGGTTATYNNAGQLTLSNAATASFTGTVIINGTTICCGCKIASGSNILTSLCAQGTIGLGNTSTDTADHLQAYTGSLLTWLPAAGAPGPNYNANSTGVDRIAVIGKIANCTGALTSTSPYTDTAQVNGAGHGSITDEFVPAGVTDWYCVVGDAGATGDIQDHWHMRLCEWTGTKAQNPSYGVGTRGTTYMYRYNHCIDNISYDSVHSQLVIQLSSSPTLEVVGPGGATTQCDGDCSFYAHELAIIQPGEEVAIQGCSQSAYNNTQWIIDSITSTQIRISHDVNNTAVTNHGTVTGGATCQASPRSLFSEWVLHKKWLNFIKSVKDSQSYFCYVPSRMCHAEVAGTGVPGGLSDQTDGASSVGFEEELRYYGTVDATSQPHCWGRISGAVSPAVGGSSAGVANGDLPLNGSQQGIWSRRREMDCTFDDTAYAKLQYLDARWGRYGHDFAIGSDNGWQQLDQNSAEPQGATGSRVGAKGYNYMASTLCPVYWRASNGNPWLQTGDINYPVAAQDLAPTIIRLFSRQYPKLKYHHINITGDGIALQDVQYAQIHDPTGPIAQRGFLLLGQYHTGQGGTGNKHSGSFFTYDKWKYIEAGVNSNDHQLWNLNDVVISNMSWSSSGGGTMTVTTSTAHGRSTGDRVWIYANPTAYNVKGSSSSGTFHDGPAITVVDSTHFTYSCSNPSATFVSATLLNQWEMVDLTSAQSALNTALVARLHAQQAAGFDPTTRRSALVTTGSGSSSLDVDGNSTPFGNGNTTRTA